MAAYILGRKVGMTRIFDEEGRSVPVTVIEAGPCHVSQVKTDEVDGYSAVQLAFADRKARTTSMPIIGHDAKAGIGPQQYHREFRVDADGVELGSVVTVETFAETKFVDVTGTSKGKGFQGVMKRHNFAGMEASHGVERKHRSPGSICGRSSNRGTGKPKKGIRMSGHMGSEQVTVRSIGVIGIDKDKNLLLLKGAVPGATGGLLKIAEAKRLYKRKAKLVQS